MTKAEKTSCRALLCQGTLDECLKEPKSEAVCCKQNPSQVACHSLLRFAACFAIKEHASILWNTTTFGSKTNIPVCSEQTQRNHRRPETILGFKDLQCARPTRQKCKGVSEMQGGLMFHVFLPDSGCPALLSRLSKRRAWQSQLSNRL